MTLKQAIPILKSILADRALPGAEAWALEIAIAALEALLKTTARESK